MTNPRGWVSQVIANIREGRHWEAYALFLVGLLIVVLGLFDVVNGKVLQSVSLLALSFLVFHTTIQVSRNRPGIDMILRGRESFTPFSRLVETAKTLDVYGPTAVNILINAADIRRFILDRGGSVRIIVQDENSQAVQYAAGQLDDSLDFEQTLHASIAVLNRLQGQSGFSYRKLAANPGFSLVVVNRQRPDAYVIFESHGFKDENIADRMHIVIAKADSSRWFSYWETRFEAMWNAAEGPNASTL